MALAFILCITSLLLLMNRRQFLRKAAGSLLPILVGITVGLNSPLIVSAQIKPTNCNSSCQQTCRAMCIGMCRDTCRAMCFGMCRGGCTGCANTCGRTCGHGSSCMACCCGRCANGCKSTCMGSNAMKTDSSQVAKPDSIKLK